MKIRKPILQRSITECDIDENEKKKVLILVATNEGDFVDVFSEDISINLLSFLLKESKGLSSSLKAKLSQNILDNHDISNPHEYNNIWETQVNKLGDIVELFTRIGIKKHNADIFFNKKWYPIIVKPRFNSASRYSPAYVSINISVSFMKEEIDLGWNIDTNYLKDAFGRNRKPKLKELFIEFGCRPQTANLNNFLKALDQVDYLLKQQNGTQMLYSGYAISSNRYNISPHKVGSTDRLDRVIIESSLEYDDRSFSYHNNESSKNTRLPYLRVFSFFNKKYFFVDVNDIFKYKYDNQAIKKLFLPSKISTVLSKVFASSSSSMYGDIIKHKHGGMIVMATGNPGVGKTSTAEVYSELQKVSLYSIDISELGTHSRQVEEQLSIIFRRVEKWNSIILFDEVDIFLTKRDDNLERSAIVGIFLRLMDYFQGVMFFTTNRPKVLDNAIYSRITLQVKYPDLDKKTREKIWNEKLNSAGIKCIDGLDSLSEIEINGREIRNMVRLAKIVLDDNTNQNEIINLIKESK